MKYNPDKHHRRSIRLKGYDYSQPGAYFVTIVAQNRERLFGEIKDGHMLLNPAGLMIRDIWERLPGRFPGIVIDAYIIMPDHFHGIIMITKSKDPNGDDWLNGYQWNDCWVEDCRQGDHKDRPHNGLGNPKKAYFLSNNDCLKTSPMMDIADISYENPDLIQYQNSPSYRDNFSKTIEDNNQACINIPTKSVQHIDSTDLATGEPCVRPLDHPDRLCPLDHPDRLCPLDHPDRLAHLDHPDRLYRPLVHRPSGTAEGSLGRIIQAFKSLTTHEYITGVKQNGWPPFPGKLWQRNYHEHIIRNKQALQAIRNYIMTNPLHWHEDKENPHRNLK